MPDILEPLNQFNQEFLLQEIDDLMIGQERLTNKENIDRIYRILDFNSFLLSLKSPVVKGQNVNFDRNATNFTLAWGQETQANNDSVEFIKFIATINIYW